MIMTCERAAKLSSTYPNPNFVTSLNAQMNSQFTHFLWSETSHAQLLLGTETDELESERQTFQNG